MPKNLYFTYAIDGIYVFREVSTAVYRTQSLEMEDFFPRVTSVRRQDFDDFLGPPWTLGTSKQNIARISPYIHQRD
jgi:hypothetical protein